MATSAVATLPRTLNPLLQLSMGFEHLEQLTKPATFTPPPAPSKRATTPKRSAAVSKKSVTKVSAAPRSKRASKKSRKDFKAAPSSVDLQAKVDDMLARLRQKRGLLASSSLSDLVSPSVQNEYFAWKPCEPLKAGQSKRKRGTDSRAMSAGCATGKAVAIRGGSPTSVSFMSEAKVTDWDQALGMGMKRSMSSEALASFRAKRSRALSGLNAMESLALETLCELGSVRATRTELLAPLALPPFVRASQLAAQRA